MKGLVAQAPDAYPGMDMSAEDIALVWYGAIVKIMYKYETADGQFTGINSNARCLVPAGF